MASLEILIQGEQAAEAAEALKATLDDGGIGVTVKPFIAEAPAGTVTRDPAMALAVAGVILAIPGAVLAALDLTQRRAKRAQLQRLQDAAREVRIEHRVETTVITLKNGQGLDKVDAEQLLALAKELAAHGPANAPKAVAEEAGSPAAAETDKPKA